MRGLLIIVLLVCVVDHDVVAVCSFYEDMLNGNNWKCDVPLENITSLFVTDIPPSKIPHLNRKILQPFKNLIHIDIGKCGIETIANDTFDGFELQYLHLNDNKIKKLEKGTLSSLNSVTSFEMTFNRLETLETDMFLGLATSTWISLSANQISKVENDAFNGLENLEYLFLASNKIENLEIDAFKHLKRLTLLDISDNKLTQIPIGLFSPLPNLQKLLLEHNQIVGLPDRIFDSLTALSTLDISQNKLTEIQDTLFGGVLENLFILKIYSNAISNFNFTNFRLHAPRIKQIELYDNPWKCPELERLRGEFLSKKVLIPVPFRINTKTNVDGISCKA